MTRPGRPSGGLSTGAGERRSPASGKEFSQVGAFPTWERFDWPGRCITWLKEWLWVIEIVTASYLTWSSSSYWIPLLLLLLRAIETALLDVSTF